MTIFRILRRQHLIAFLDSTDSIDSLDVLDSTVSIEVTDSMDIIDSIDSILVPHKETATHKGARASRAHKSTDGGGGFAAAPIGTFVFPLCVAVSLCGTSIESIESKISIESVTSMESVESRTSRESIESVESTKSV